MKRMLLIALLCAGFGFKVPAQDTGEDAVRTAVNHLFEGMKKGDSSLAGSAFAPQALLQTIKNQNGKVSVQTEPVAEFLKLIGTPHKQVYDERIEYVKILIDGPLASVWTNYKFYLDGTFSHCGVNSFQLVKTEAGWQIIYVIDTRRKENCN